MVKLRVYLGYLAEVNDMSVWDVLDMLPDGEFWNDEQRFNSRKELREFVNTCFLESTVLGECYIYVN